MPSKSVTNKAAAPARPRVAGPAYDLFDSLKKARLKAAQSRQKKLLPDTDNQLEKSAAQGDE